MFRFNLFIPARFYDQAGSVSGGAGAGSAPPVASPSPAAGASTPPSGSQSSASPTDTTPATTTTPGGLPNPTDDIADGNWKELRTRYESQRQELATMKAQSSSASAVITSAQSIAKSLGYSDQDFLEAFTSDPMKTLDILRQEEAARGGQPNAPDDKGDLTKQIEDAINAKLTPIQEAHNRQATEVAMAKYESSLGEAVSADPVLKGAPEEVISIVKDYLGEYFASQPQILLAMKTKGDFSAVPDAVKFISGRLHGAFKSWLSKTNSGQPGSSLPTASGRPNGRPSLDDIIDDPGVLGSQYK